MTQVERALPDDVVAFLSGGNAVVLATVDAAGNPFTTIVTWIVARDNRTLAFAIDRRGRAFENIQANGLVAGEILGDDINYACRGRAHIERESMSTPPFPSALAVFTIEETRNHASPGVRFQGPRYFFEKGKDHRLAVEQAIYEELRLG